MKKPAFSLHRRFLSVLGEKLGLKRTSSHRDRSRIEPLETRYAPATFAGTGGPSLNIFVDHPGEALSITATGAAYTVSSAFPAVDGGNTGGNVSGFGTTTASIQAGAFTTITITDSAGGTSVTFLTSGVNAYSSAFDIVLDDPTASDLSFTGNSTFNGGLSASVTGSIVQTGPIVAQSTVSLTSTNGAITLTDPTNNFSVISLETTGANSISLRTLATLTLDHVTTETGNLTITSGSGIGQTSNGRIHVGGTATLDVTGGANVAIQLNGAANFFGGPVLMTETGGDIGSISLRNVSPAAALPNLTDLSAGDLSSLTLVFDGSGIAIDAATESVIGANGSLNVTAGGQITQTAPITLGTLNVTALGNHGITLNDPANNVTTVSLNNPAADGGTQSGVSYTNTDGFTFATSHLGLGTFSATALTGNIDETGPILQRLGAGRATFTLTAGTSLALDNASNIFAGPVRIVGNNVNTVAIEDANTLASVPDLTDVADTLTDLTLHFDNAPAVLPSYTLSNLDVNADGIFQATGSALLISGNAHFASGAFGINLTNTGNDFNTLSLSANGRDDVSVFDLDDLAFGNGNSGLGTGRLNVTAGGAITQTANRITQASGAGPASFTAPSVNLTQPNNNFVGELRLETTGDASVVDTNALLLGQVHVGGNLALTAGSNITQAAGTSLSVTGVSSFDSGAGSNITLDNAGNALTGAVTFTDGNVTFRNNIPVTFSGTNSVASLHAHANGPIGQAPGSALGVSGASSFEAGANAILLDSAGNNFVGAVALSSTGAVTIRDLNAIQLGNVNLGAAPFTVNATGNITQLAGTAIIQTGPGALSLFGGPANNVTLNQAGNDLRGLISVDANAVTVNAHGDISFAPTSDIDGNFNATAGGTLTLPTVAANLNDLGTVNLSAARIIVGSDLATDSGTGITFTGTTELPSNVTFGTSAVNRPITFDGDVKTAGPLTLNVGTSDVLFLGGTWTQGANALTINSTGATAFQIGNAVGTPAIFVASGGAILNLNASSSGKALSVKKDGVFHVGTSDGTAEIVTLNSGSNGSVIFDPGSALQVGFGGTNDRLVINGAGDATIDGARLIGSGATGSTPSDVLQVTGGGALFGEFSHSRDSAGELAPFLAGSDIVLASYLPTSAGVGQGGTASTTGTVSGILADGGKYTVSHSGKGAAGLVVIENSDGGIDIAVRNNIGAGTLTIATTKLSGDGITDVGGIGVSGTGSLTIAAASVNLHGDVLVAGPLSALTIRDVIAAPSAPSIVIHAGGTASSLTTVTGHTFDGVQIEIGGVLNKLTLAQFLESDSTNQLSSVVAERIGTVKINGDAKMNLAGDLAADITNLNSLSSTLPALSSATIAGHLSGTWDLAGSVGTVSAKSASSWMLGLAGAHTVNPAGATSANSLSLGQVANSTLNVGGSLATLKANDWSGGTIKAGSIGTLSITANSTANLFGNFTGVNLTVSGTAAGTAIKTLSVAGNLSGATIHLLDGNVTAFTVGRELLDSSITANDTATGGRFNSITVGRWNNTDLDAESVGTLSVKGNAAAGLFGDVLNSDLTLRGAKAGVALATFSATGTMDTSRLFVMSGDVTKLSVARDVSVSTIYLESADSPGGVLKSFSAGRLAGSTITAKSIGTLNVTGAAQTSPASPLLVGDVASSTILAFLNTGNSPGLGTMKIAGSLDTSSVIARNGITSLMVGRSVDTSTITADNVLTGNLSVGRIGTLTAGEFIQSNLTANTLGKFSTTGFTQLEVTPVKTAGDVDSSVLLIKGASTSGTKAAVDSFTVAGNLIQTRLTAPGGTPLLTVKQGIDSSNILLDNPASQTAGKLGTLTAGDWFQTTLRANTIGTLKTVGNPATFILGSFDNDTLGQPAVTVAGSTTSPTAPLAIMTFSVAGDLQNTGFNVPAGIKTFKGAGAVTDSDLAVAFGTNAKIATLSAGAWLNSDVTSRAIMAWNITGNSARGIAGNVTDSLVTILGSSGGVGLGKVVAQGTVSGSTFQVTDGNVTEFTVGRFLDSNLFAGFSAGSTVDVTKGGTFGSTDRTIALFKTTEPFVPTDPDSVSFAGSNVVAADLGKINLLGVDPSEEGPALFGIGFETGKTAGKVQANLGTGLLTLVAPVTNGAFTYRPL